MSIKFVSIRNSPLEQALPNVNIKPIILGLSHKTIKSKQTLIKAAQLIGDTKPDIFWLMKDEHISPKLLRRYKKICPKMKFIMWYGDQRGNIIHPLIAQRKDVLDAVFITNEWPAQLKMYRKFGIKYAMTFYHSFSTDEFKLWNIPPKHEVFFGGSKFKPKKFPLCALRSEFIQEVYNQFDLVVHGGGWPFATQPWVLRNQYAKELRKAKINLGVNHYNVMNYYNRRLFESVASGRLHITHYIPGMEKHFKNRQHLAWFNTIPEGIQLINFYLKHPKERERVAKIGRDFFIKYHSWPVRVRELRNKLERILT